jgi:hypothetical protein
MAGGSSRHEACHANGHVSTTDSNGERRGGACAGREEWRTS